MSPVRNVPGGSKTVQSGSAVKKSLRFDKGDSVYEGEGDKVNRGELDTFSQMAGERVRETVLRWGIRVNRAIT